MQIISREKFILNPALLLKSERLQTFLFTAAINATAYLTINIEKEYIDQIRLDDLVEPVTIGKDQYGRLFFAFVVEVFNKEGVWEKATYVVFNRYTDNPETWQGAHSENELVGPGSRFPPNEVELILNILQGSETRLKNDGKREWNGCVVRLWQKKEIC